MRRCVLGLRLMLSIHARPCRWNGMAQCRITPVVRQRPARRVHIEARAVCALSATECCLLTWLPCRRTMAYWAARAAGPAGPGFARPPFRKSTGPFEGTVTTLRGRSSAFLGVSLAVRRVAPARRCVRSHRTARRVHGRPLRLSHCLQAERARVPRDAGRRRLRRVPVARTAPGPRQVRLLRSRTLARQAGAPRKVCSTLTLVTGPASSAQRSSSRRRVPFVTACNHTCVLRSEAGRLTRCVDVLRS